MRAAPEIGDKEKELYENREWQKILKIETTKSHNLNGVVYCSKKWRTGDY